jgi:hypothetical protein
MVLPFGPEPQGSGPLVGSAGGCGAGATAVADTVQKGNIALTFRRPGWH